MTLTHPSPALGWPADRLADVSQRLVAGKGDWHLAPVRVMQGRLTRKCAASPGIPARRACGCYLVSPFVAAGPSLARSSGLVASSTFSANFRWEASSCSAKS